MVLNSGEVNYGDVMTIFPFGDQMIMATVDGGALWEVFEHSVKGFSLTSRHGKFLQVSGTFVISSFQSSEYRFHLNSIFMLRFQDPVRFE